MGRNQPPPLEATIDTAAITLGSRTYTHTFTNPVLKYLGQRLFLNATSDGTLLSITITDNATADSPPPALGASSAEITVSYDQTATPEHWILPAIAYAGGTPIAVGMSLNPKWENATLVVGAPLPVPAPAEVATLDYVLVHGAADAAQPEHFMMYWFSRPAMLDPDAISSATFVPEAGGAITGPFGISAP